MLGIVPKLYEDELFYSWLCRYYVAKGFTSNSHFIEEVTGNNRLYLNKEFVPPFKAEFRHDIEKIFGFENVIRNHTLHFHRQIEHMRNAQKNLHHLFHLNQVFHQHRPYLKNDSKYKNLQ